MKCDEKDHFQAALPKRKKRCKKRADINKWLKNKSFIIYMKQNIVDLEDFHQPIKSKLRFIGYHDFNGKKQSKSLILA